MLRELPRTDPALWERISRPPSTDLDESDSDSDDDASSQTGDDDDGSSGLEDDPFRDDDEFDDDSWMEPAQLMAQILDTEIESPSVASAYPGAADDVEVDLEAVHVPESELGRGKRRRVTTKKFDGYLGH